MIEIKALTKKFGTFTALNDINLDLKQGRSVALIGPNGCGKTTLIKCIIGLNVVGKGKVFVNGNDVSLNYHYREHIGYMPQIGHYPENMTIGQTITLIRNTRKLKIENLDTELLEAFELEKMSDKKMGTLSGGTMQKVSAVLAFMFAPQVVILDEPTAGLDPIAAEILKNKIIKERNNGKLILITSHLLSELDDLVNEIIFMNEGEIIVHQSVQDLLKENQTEKISDAVVHVLKQMKEEQYG